MHYESMTGSRLCTVIENLEPVDSVVDNVFLLNVSLDTLVTVCVCVCVCVCACVRVSLLTFGLGGSASVYTWL